MALVLGIDRHILKTGYLQPGYLANICHSQHTKKPIERFGVVTFLGVLQIRGQFFPGGFPCLALDIGELDRGARFLSAQISG